jgi:predicted site-specific integrase-resolvase
MYAWSIHIPSKQFGKLIGKSVNTLQSRTAPDPVINGETFSTEEKLVRDLIAIVTVFSARLHGLRSHKHLIRAAALGKDITDDQGTQDQTPSHA